MTNILFAENKLLQLRVVNEEMRFEIVPKSGENTSQVVSMTFNAKGAWHRVEIDYKEQMLYLDIDYKFIRRHEVGAIEFGDHVMLASSTRRNTGTNPAICIQMENKLLITIKYNKKL